MHQCGELLFKSYLEELFKFSTSSYKSQNVSIVYHAGQLNGHW